MPTDLGRLGNGLRCVFSGMRTGVEEEEGEVVVACRH